MTVRDVAIVGRNNRYGLTRDAGILRQGLASIGVRQAQAAVERLVTTSPDTARSLGMKARERFEELSQGFATQLRAVFDQVLP